MYAAILLPIQISHDLSQTDVRWDDRSVQWNQLLGIQMLLLRALNHLTTCLVEQTAVSVFCR